MASSAATNGLSSNNGKTRGFQDLPDELLGIIAKYHVNNVGVAAAWSGRHISRNFASEVKYAIVAKQPARAFGMQRRTIAALPVTVLSLALEWRKKFDNNTYGFSKSGIDFLVTIANVITLHGGIIDIDAQDILLKVCEATVANSDAVINLITPAAKAQAYSDGPGYDEALMVAITFRDCRLIQALLGTDTAQLTPPPADIGSANVGPVNPPPVRSSMFSRTHLFGHVFLFIAKHYDLETFEWFISQAMPAAAGNLRGVHNRNLSYQIIFLMEIQEEYARALYKLYVKSFDTPTGAFAVSCFKAATKYCATEFIGNLLSTPNMGRYLPRLRQEFLSQHYYYKNNNLVAHALLVCGLFDQDNVNDEEPITNAHQYTNPTSQSILDIAVNTGDDFLVQEILMTYHAHPDGVMLNLGRRSYPLRQAIGLGHAAVVMRLLEYGAEPSMGFSSIEEAWALVQEYWRGWGLIENVMRHALMTQKRAQRAQRVFW